MTDDALKDGLRRIVEADDPARAICAVVDAFEQEGDTAYEGAFRVATLLAAQLRECRKMRNDMIAALARGAEKSDA